MDLLNGRRIQATVENEYGAAANGREEKVIYSGSRTTAAAAAAIVTGETNTTWTNDSLLREVRRGTATEKPSQL